MTNPLGDYELLAKHFNDAGLGTGPASKDIANFILLNSKPVPAAGSSKKSKPSLMSRIFDILSRGNYAAAEFTHRAATAKDPLQAPFEGLAGAWEGLTGEKKTTFSEVLKKDFNAEPGFGTSAVGLGLDIFADPLTYVPVAGLVSKAKGLSKAGKASAEAVSLTPDTQLGEKLLRQGEPARPESFGLPGTPPVEIPRTLSSDINPTVARDSLTTTPKAEVEYKPGAMPGTSAEQPALPGFEFMGKTPETPPVEVPVKHREVKGQLPLKFKDFSISEIRERSANVTAAKIAAGDPNAVSRIMPAPKPTPTKKHEELAQDLLSRWKPEATKSEFSRKNPGSISAPQQVKLFYRAIDQAKRGFTNPNAAVNKPRVMSNAYKIYIAAEKALETAGYIPRVSGTEVVRLSDVIAKSGTNVIQDTLDNFVKPKIGSDTWKAIEDLRAQNAIKDTPVVQEVISKIAEAKAEVKAASTLSDAQQFDFDKFAKNFGKASAKAKGASPAAAEATGKLIDMMLRSDKSAAQVAVEQSSKMLDDVIRTGRQNAETNVVLTKALEKNLGKLPVWSVTDNKAVESVMGRMATWWGQKDLRPNTLNAMGAAKATATVRGEVLANLFKPFDIAQRHDALKLAQGYGVPTSPEVEQLATEIRKMIDNMVSPSSASSVLSRSALDIKMLNKWMDQYFVGFHFTKSKRVEDQLGVMRDFSKGSDWTNSWQTAVVKDDPQEFLFKFQQALEQATREKAVFTDLAERFGTRVPTKGGFRNKVTGHPYLDGYYFTDDIAKQIPRLVKDWNTPAWAPKSSLVRHYDRVLSMWKSGVTIYRPAHHIRNHIGDIYLGWMDGVNSIRPYQLAARVQKSMRGAYQTMADVDNLIDMGLMTKNLKTPAPNEILFRNKSGVPFTSEQIAAVAHQKGLLEHTSTLEDIIDMGETGRKTLLDVKPFGGKVQAVARGASELQSHNARLAHFIDKVMKSHGSDLPGIFEKAAQRSRKWHPTGLDLTDFEKKYLRRIMPFYTWMRKSLPLLAEGLVMNPGKSVVPAKVSDTAQEMAGVEQTDGRLDPFPVDQMFPSWIKAEGIGPLSLPDGILGSFSNQSPPGYVMAGMGMNPLSSLIPQIENPGKTLASSITPGIQIPMELATGRKTFTGEAITGDDARPGALSQYVGENIPVWSILQGVTGITPTGDLTKREATSDGNIEALVNLITGAGIRGTGQYRDQGAYEQFAPGRGKREVGKEDLMRELRRIVEEGK